MKKFGSIDKIRNIGAKTIERLNALGINTTEDLITFFPRDYEDRTEISNIANLIEGETNTFKAKIASIPMSNRFKNKVITKVVVTDGTVNAELTWFNQGYLEKQLKPGDEYIFVGKAKRGFGKIQVDSPKYEKVTEKESMLAGRIVPKYPLTFGLSQHNLQKIIKNALDKVLGILSDDMPTYVRQKYGLIEYDYAIKNIHFPDNNEAYQLAKKRLIFEELFTTQLGLLYVKHKVKEEDKGIRFEIPDNMDKVKSMLPFELTGAQRRVLEEIEKDMSSDKVMNRLVQGDVGSGKTVIALMSMYVAVANKYQAAMMAPTEILALQHYEFLASFLFEFGLKAELLVGSMTKKQKQDVYDKIKRGDVDIVVGTHALIQNELEFYNLGLVITDEQHRFGVEQRMKLTSKGESPDTLVMTATPIPRTLGLILYGDLDISIIDELPKGRQKIDTYYVTSAYKDRMYNFVAEQINEGRQAYIVCPMVEENEDMSELKSVVEYTKQLKSTLLGKYKIEYLHGKMKAKEKNDIMMRYKNGEINILVSTTVIEVGISVSNATIMIIENAERFGLAQLHQLRGRVGRGVHKSYCILVTDAKGKVIRERMEVMKGTNDGFIIAEKDLELRGMGDFFGTKQHGLPEFKIANLYEHADILKTSQQAARELIETDPLLGLEDNRNLKEKIEEMLEYQVL